MSVETEGAGHEISPGFAMEVVSVAGDGPMITPTPETPAGGLTTTAIAERLRDRRNPHDQPLPSEWATAEAVVDLLAQSRAEDRARIEAALRLVSPDHLTPMGKRIILNALTATEDGDRP